MHSKYELVEAARLLFLLLHDMTCLKEACQELKEKVNASLNGSPKDRITGVIVLPKGTDLESTISWVYRQDLARSRIAVHVSGFDDMQAGAQKIEQEIMATYILARDWAANLPRASESL